MELFKKRIKAQLIDFVLIAFLALPFHSLISNQYLTMAVVIVLYICRDLLFRNASFGKKLQGIIVVDDYGNVPSVKQLLLRNIPTVILISLEFVQIKNGEERIGDTLADTNVILKEKI